MYVLPSIEKLMLLLTSNMFTVSHFNIPPALDHNLDSFNPNCVLLVPQVQSGPLQGFEDMIHKYLIGPHPSMSM